jgi:hypothetical protein
MASHGYNHRPLKGSSEAHAKAAVINHFRAVGQLKHGSTLASEFTVPKLVRADLALLDSAITFIEIKTQRDTLRRLNGQVEAYERSCDRLILVLADRHLKALESDDYPCAEIWALDGANALTLRREPMRDPVLDDVDRFLTQEERRRLAQPASLSLGSNDRARALALLKQRFQEPNARFWRAVRTGQVKPTHLELLSRFREARAFAASVDEEAQRRWHAWENQAEQIFGPREAAVA